MNKKMIYHLMISINSKTYYDKLKGLKTKGL